MTEANLHINQWRHNRRFLSEIPLDFHDWIVTVAFYAALHAVDTLLTHDRVPGINRHEERNRVLAETNRYKQINRHYKPLYGLARTVRYFADPGRWVPADQIDTQVLRRYLYPVEASVQKLMSRDLGLAPVVLRDTAR